MIRTITEARWGRQRLLLVDLQSIAATWVGLDLSEPDSLPTSSILDGNFPIVGAWLV